MRARVKSTGEIVEVIFNSPYYDTIDGKERYYHYELDFQDIFDYWERLEHTYAGMAMQGFISSKRGLNIETDMYDIPYYSQMLAHALVEKMKEDGK